MSMTAAASDGKGMGWNSGPCPRPTPDDVTLISTDAYPEPVRITAQDRLDDERDGQADDD